MHAHASLAAYCEAVQCAEHELDRVGSYLPLGVRDVCVAAWMKGLQRGQGRREREHQRPSGALTMAPSMAAEPSEERQAKVPHE